MSAREVEAIGRRRPSISNLHRTTSSQSTFAAFPPASHSYDTPSSTSEDLNMLIPQKTPLLLATPPQVVRVLTCSHPYLLSLNQFLGLLTWSTNDPYQSFLLLSTFWALVLYGDSITKRVGPVFPCLLLAAYMCNRWLRGPNENTTSQPAFQDRKVASNGHPAGMGTSIPQNNHVNRKPLKPQTMDPAPPKTIEEIINTLQELTRRLQALIDPVLDLFNFITMTSNSVNANRKPFLETTYIRLILVAPLWLALTIPPLRIITAKRVVLLVGTLFLTWHSQFMRVARNVLWRSARVRHLVALITGLPFQVSDISVNGARIYKEPDSGCGKAHTPQIMADRPGMKACFAMYENQRRWVGLGWTTSLFSHERAAWTDELNNATRSKDEFQLPDIRPRSRARWIWSTGSQWTIERIADVQGNVDLSENQGLGGWVYYDHKWRNGRSEPGLGTWTRRRKWYRNAELVE